MWARGKYKRVVSPVLLSGRVEVKAEVEAEVEVEVLSLSPEGRTKRRRLPEMAPCTRERRLWLRIKAPPRPQIAPVALGNNNTP